MGLFDDKETKKKIQYLEEERKKLWDRIVRLEEQNIQIREEIITTASESQAKAFQHLKKTSEFRNRTEKRLSEADEFIIKIKDKLNEAETLYSNILDSNNEVTSLKTEIENTDTDYKVLFGELKEKVDNLSNFMEEYPELDDKLSQISQFISDIENNSNKSKGTLSSINSRKKEIDEFYDEIFGYIDVNEDDEEIFIEGKKKSLENLYQDLKEDISKATEKISIINDNYKNQYLTFEQKYRTKYSTFENEHKSKYNGIVTQIEALLPGALTTGLSFAFSDKKKEEKEQSDILQKRFKFGIFLLIGVSVIPFVINIIYMFQGHNLDEAILKIPQLVLAIIPMYIPILWFTYSSSKKLNLSKRLIEEYSHKEALSKTYEGLSKQISNIDDDGQSEELKYRLLSAFLQVTSENPGKLISNYETSDHPLMEALEQSYKFQIAIDKLEGIPGMRKIVAILEKKAKKRLEEKEKIINKVMSNEQHKEDEEDVEEKV
ncbi:hypothetical protein [Capnocytophaga canimorsus]|uniref:hypothetical protein n=1 Tax=Capnocytophaga canimorsus TaxID=28188 RepID=UPI001562C5E0|nr:hypothetical protein [Capnocytophaga canimorsus]